MAAGSTIYCDLDDVRNILSEAGVTLRTDDLDAESDTDILDDASADIEMYCWPIYGANLANSRWVGHKCAHLAAEKLCERRGNPAPLSLKNECDRIRTQLERIRTGAMVIPDCSMTSAAVPRLSNQRIVLRPSQRTVVERSKSTGAQPTVYRQKVDPADQSTVAPWDYSI